jgi:uncharacterized protein (DUF58 family)
VGGSGAVDLSAVLRFFGFGTSAGGDSVAIADTASRRSSRSRRKPADEVSTDQPSAFDDRGMRGRVLVPLGPRYHLHWPGIVYVITTMMLALGAIQGQNNLLYWAFGLAVGGLLVSGAVSGAMLLAVRVEREIVGAGPAGAQGAARAGESVRFIYHITNRSHFVPVFGIVIDELTGREGGLSRKRAKVNWSSKIESNEQKPRAFAAHVAPRTRITVTGTADAIARGEASVDALRVWTTFPFGLARKSVLFGLKPGEKQSVIIRPRASTPDRSVLDAAGGRGVRGRMSTKRRGTPDEFFSLREFSEGDPLRLVSWRASARASGGAGDTLLVRQFQSTGARRLWIDLDLANVKGPEAERRISAAAGYIDAASHEDAAVGLVVEAFAISIPPRSGPRHAGALLDALGAIDLTNPPPATRGFIGVPAGESVVVIAGSANTPLDPAAPDTVKATTADEHTDDTPFTTRVLAWFGFGESAANRTQPAAEAASNAAGTTKGDPS